MSDKDAVIREVMAGLEREPKIDVITIRFPWILIRAFLLLEGQVKDIAAKKLALELGAAVASVTGIVDRLKVAAAGMAWSQQKPRARSRSMTPGTSSGLTG